MNKIYKIVWSKAKHAYVVTSEVARSHTKSASGKAVRRHNGGNVKRHLERM